MAAPAVLKIDIIANAQKALSAMKDTEQGATGIESSFKSVGKVVGGALGTAAVVSFGKASFTAAQESAVATARLENVFKSMGDETGNAAKAAEDYAGALSKKIGVEDESILAAQAQLATFGAVSDETARTAGIFDRATSAAADLAAAGFGSLDTNAVQLGKALQDPTKGITALAKSGVTFTDSQKEQIAAMQKSGDLLGAQKIVLAAVEGQVKGTAEATATNTGKMNVAFGELQETIGGKLAPVVNALTGFMTKYMDLLIPLGAVILGVVLAMKAYELITNAVKIAQAAWNVVQIAFNVIMAANPIMLVVIAIAALVAAVILAYTKVGWFRDFVDAAFQGIVTAFGWIKDAAQAVFSWLASNWPTLLAILTGPIGIAVLLITKNWDTLKDAAKAVVDWVGDRFRDLVGVISRIAETLGGIMSAIVNAIKWPIDAATEMFNWVSDKFSALLDVARGIKDSLSNIMSDVVGIFKAPINAVIRAWNSISFEIPKVHVPGTDIDIGGGTVHVPRIPELARGGRVLATGLAVVHEGEQFSGVGKTFGNNITVNITTTGLGADAPQIQRAVVRALQGWQSRNGVLPVTTRDV